MILAISKIFYRALFSTSEYFKRYGGQGTRGRRGLIQPARGGWNQQIDRHTAKNDFNNNY